MTRRERLVWDWLIRRFSIRGLARKYKITKRQAEQAIRIASERMRKGGYP